MEEYKEIKKFIQIGKSFLNSIRESVFEQIDTKIWNKTIVLSRENFSGIGKKLTMDLIKMSSIDAYYENIIDFKYGLWNFINEECIVIIIGDELENLSKLEKEIINKLVEKEVKILYITKKYKLDDYKNFIIHIEETNNEILNSILYLNAIQVICFYKSLNMGQNPDGTYEMLEVF